MRGKKKKPYEKYLMTKKTELRSLMVYKLWEKYLAAKSTTDLRSLKSNCSGSIRDDNGRRTTSLILKYHIRILLIKHHFS